MPKKNKKKIKKSWSFIFKKRFADFFSWVKTTFLELFNLNQEEDDEEESAEVAEALEKDNAYQKACDALVINAEPGTDFTVSQEDLELLKLFEDQCRKAYQAKHATRLDAYIKKHSGKFPALLDKNSKLYKDTEQKVSKSLEKSPEKLALNKAGKAAQALKEKHSIAFAKAIRNHGQGKLLRLNGICLERIQDVGGMNNNCGANVMMHIFLEHWDKLNFEDENTKSLGRNLCRAAFDKQPELKILSIADLKTHIDSFSFSEQEKIFTPAVRKHLGKTLMRSEPYFQIWVAMQLPELDKNLLNNIEKRKRAHQENCDWDRDLFTSPEYQSYYKYRFKSPQERANEKLEALQQTSEFLNASDSNKAKMMKEIEDKREKDQAEKEGLERALFKSSYKRLGDEKNAIQIAEYELFKYADIMGVNLKVYLKQGNLTKALYHHEHDDLNPISVNIVNLGNYHWQYERNSDKPKLKKEVLEAPVAPTKGKGPKVPPATSKNPAPAVPDNKPGVPPAPPAQSKLKNKKIKPL